MQYKTVKEFGIGRIYKCIKNDFNNQNIKIGDFISILGINTTYDRHSRDKRMVVMANKVVVLNSHTYTPSEDLILSDWHYDCFLEVDHETIDTDLHNKYVMTMKTVPETLIEV